MGCCTSTAHAAPWQKKEVFRMAMREMLTLCVEGALRNRREVTIAAPCSKKEEEAAAAGTQGVKGHAEDRGGAVGILLGRLGEMAGRTSQALADAKEASYQTVLTGPLSSVGTDIIQKHQDEILQIYKGLIDRIKPRRPLKHVRGKYPHGPAQAKACKGNSITKWFMGKTREKLRQQLAPLVKVEVEARALTKAWKALSSSLSTWQGEEDTLDLTTHVTKELVEQIAILMGKEEAELRKSPAGKSSRPWTFEFCFSVDTPPLNKGLPLKVYKNRNK